MAVGYRPPNRVCGVAFRAAERTAGEKTWVARCRADGDALRVESCRTASDRFGVSPERPTAVRVLSKHVASLAGGTAVGFDFPFGLPSRVVLGRS